MTSPDRPDGESSAREEKSWRRGWNGQNITALIVAVTSFVVSATSLLVMLEKNQAEKEAESAAFARHVVIERYSFMSKRISVANYNAMPVRIKILGAEYSGNPKEEYFYVTYEYAQATVQGCTDLSFSIPFSSLVPVLVDPQGNVWLYGREGMYNLLLFRRIQLTDGKMFKPDVKSGDMESGPLGWRHISGDFSRVLSSEGSYIYPSERSAGILPEKKIKYGCGD
ncbi:hypothetical protein ABT052_28400 [Streptomyces sp. NPDC002766]|uniref:hypothetical protein n=1 Tax=Streptomyces sp. NPDC002766 TaxID=3154429 RepID=UPI0033178563